MKRIFFLVGIFLFMTSPLFGGEETHLSRGHNQIEIEGLQSIDVSPVLEMPTTTSIDLISQDDGTTFHVSKKPILTLKDFTNARISDKDGVLSLNLGLTKPGGKKIHEFSSKNVGQKLAFIVNGKLLKAPEIKVPIDGKGLSIDPMDRRVAEKLVSLINQRTE